MLATKISFMNEIAGALRSFGRGISKWFMRDRGLILRIGYHFIYAGAGYGGSCFPKDVQALIQTSNQLEFDAKLLKSVEARNSEQKKVLFNKIFRYFNGDIGGKVLLFGDSVSNPILMICGMLRAGC